MRLTAIVLPFLYVFSVASSALVPRSIPERSCGTQITKAKKDKIGGAFRIAQATARRPSVKRKIVVDTRFHVVAENRTLEGGWVPKSQIHEQIAVLNRAYSPSQISFDLKSVTYTINPRWFYNVTFMPDSVENGEMKRSLHRGDRKTLNIYSVRFDGLEETEGLLGYSSFPTDYDERPWDDGVVIRYSSLPGGTYAPYNLGHSLTHETGHWFGLYHTFEGGCWDEDEVKDTPPQFSPTLGCPPSRNSCFEDDLDDPIHNYMDYSSDICKTEFTPGQSERMASLNVIYRHFELYWSSGLPVVDADISSSL